MVARFADAGADHPAAASGEGQRAGAFISWFGSQFDQSPNVQFNRLGNAVKQFRLDGGVARLADMGRRRPIAEASRHLALKLRLTSLVLCCSTHKELCARFATGNRTTQFVPQNAYKWLSGKAMPRSSSVYEDWARVLGGALTAPFLASSSFEEFQDAVCTRFVVPETALSALRAEAGLPRSPAQVVAISALTRGSEQQPGGHWLEGTYLAISPAWSRADAGRLIIGAVSIHTDAMQRLQISYGESLPGRQVLMSGPLQSDGRSAQSALTCSYTRRLSFLGLNVPKPPANLIGGVLSRAAVHDPDARATASRILLLRGPGARAEGLVARASNLDADGALVESELAALGYRDDAARAALGAGIVDFLSTPSSSSLCEVQLRDLAPLEMMIDRLAPPAPLHKATAWH
ncbi:hypothetical protein DK26_20385 [Bosea sp. WAO]|uniref:hypothetical protein n=1 Tax=Bosea sp. WAO TaxID=406341 RepID=UPI00074A1EED|nr:hypothetical protein [Bosea sp. WAO]KUL94068.1 hypothetical protein DK26_20385 [Bosea sp. WAO]